MSDVFQETIELNLKRLRTESQKCVKQYGNQFVLFKFIVTVLVPH